MEDLLVEELKDLYSAEGQFVKAFPKIRDGASDELKAALQRHLDVTKQQTTHLEDIFPQLNEKAQAKPCNGTEILLEEGAESLEDEDKGPLRDLQLIAAAQRVEHYQIAAYGTARAMAEKSGLAETVKLLQETLEEEDEADKRSTKVAESLYNEVEMGSRWARKNLAGRSVKQPAAEANQAAALSARGFFFFRRGARTVLTVKL